MPRAHLSKRLDDATAIRLFAEHHITHTRRRKNGEIVAVKHSVFGWMGPSTYYNLQKAHELIPLVQEFVKGGYMAKLALWNSQLEIAGFSVPIGGSLPAVETWNLIQELIRTPPDPLWIAIRLYALIGPWGDVLQLIDSALWAAGGLPALIGGVRTDSLARRFLNNLQNPDGSFKKDPLSIGLSFFGAIIGIGKESPVPSA